MFFRYFLALCVIAFAVQMAESANPAVKVVTKLLESLFEHAAKSCLGEAAEQCKGDWKHPETALQCGKNFLAANKGRCAAD